MVSYSSEPVAVHIFIESVCESNSERGTRASSTVKHSRVSSHHGDCGGREWCLHILRHSNTSDDCLSSVARDLPRALWQLLVNTVLLLFTDLSCLCEILDDQLHAASDLFEHLDFTCMAEPNTGIGSVAIRECSRSVLRRLSPDRSIVLSTSQHRLFADSQYLRRRFENVGRNAFH